MQDLRRWQRGVIYQTHPGFPLRDSYPPTISTLQSEMPNVCFERRIAEILL